jgi:rare lipoprotein A
MSRSQAAALLLLSAAMIGQPSGSAAQSTTNVSAGGALSGAVGTTQTGLAAYYSQRLHGGQTASGERFDNDAMTTAHQTLPYGTRVRITNTRNGKSVDLRVNDRGPTQPKRIVDVSRRAAEELGFVKDGLVEVKLEVVEAAPPSRR